MGTTKATKQNDKILAPKQRTLATTTNTPKPKSKGSSTLAIANVFRRPSEP